MSEQHTKTAVLDKLLEGNRRFAESASTHPRQSADRRLETAQGQNPFAVIVGCSDSRVPPEIVFDQGIGDLFVIRVAGNVIDDHALGSIEYAVEHLGVQLILVLGHSNCGAVDAALQESELPGHLASLKEALLPAVDHARNQQGDVLQNAVKANVRNVVSSLMSSQPILHPFVEKEILSIAGAYYDWNTGIVHFID